MQKGKFNILVDCAWGSSGKGAVAARLADIHRPTDLSASNFPNAGHTVVVRRGGETKKFVFKTLPSGAAHFWQDSSFIPELWIGPNSGFWADALVDELHALEFPEMRLHVHPRAVVMHQRHIEMESPSGEQSTEHISSTMSGSGAAFAEKAMRRPNVSVAGSFHLSDRKFSENFHRRLGTKTFLHEVSQGYALSINHGTHYPHCTFRDCTPQQAISDFMVRPDQVGDVYLNIRSFPIRVGNNFRDGQQTGYSGDWMPDQKELTWQEVALLAEMPPIEAAELQERERTTVTKKVRRVATQSFLLCAEAAKLCGATKLVLNFPQYVHWSAHQVRGGEKEFRSLHPKVRAHIEKLEEVCNLPCVMVGTGAAHEDYIFREGL